MEVPSDQRTPGAVPNQKGAEVMERLDGRIYERRSTEHELGDEPVA